MAKGILWISCYKIKFKYVIYNLKLTKRNLESKWPGKNDVHYYKGFHHVVRCIMQVQGVMNHFIRISWGGIKNLELVDNKLRGKTYDTIDRKWTDFELDLETKEIKGGSFREFLLRNGQIRSWWKIWKTKITTK